MSLETAKAAVTFTYNNLKKKRELTQNPNLKGIINFFGGEPMLRYDAVIKPLTLWIKETYPDDFNLGITTNGTLLTKEVIDFFAENQIKPLLSMDGDRETQEYNRPCVARGASSFDMVMPTIPYLLEKFPNTVFRMTIYEDTCDKLFENILFAEKQGFKYFFATPDSRHNFSEENELKLKVELKKYYTYLIGSIIQGVKPIECSSFRDMFITVLKEPSLKIQGVDSLMPREIMRCGLGTTSASIGPDGKIYGCQEQVTKEENIFYIGDIFSGINEERQRALIEEFRQINMISCEEISLCKDCNYKDFCYQVRCPSMAKERFDDFFIVPKTECFWTKTLFELSKEVLGIYHENIEKYLSELIEEVRQYELHC